MNKCTRSQHFQGDVLEPGKKQKNVICMLQIFREKFREINFHEKFRENEVPPYI